MTAMHAIVSDATGGLRELGANEVVNYTINRFEDVVSNIDVVVDLIGNLIDGTASRSLRALKPGGLIITVSSGSWPTMAQDADGVRLAADGSTFAAISRLLESGDVRVFVDQVFELQDAAAAHVALETGHTRGKIVLTVSPG